MLLSVSLLPGIRPLHENTDTAVVIDVLRATSVMTTAIANGASEIRTCESIPEAEQAAAEVDKTSGRVALVCGERDCVRIPSFDLGNSPSEYPPEVVQDRSIVMTTTNGTRAVAATSNAREVLIASFLNLSSTVERIAKASSTHLICAGTNGEITLEDVSLAGAIISSLQHRTKVELVGDDAILSLQLWLSWFPTGVCDSPDLLATRFETCLGGRNLMRVGYGADLERCAIIDQHKVVIHRKVGSNNLFVKAT